MLALLATIIAIGAVLFLWAEAKKKKPTVLPESSEPTFAIVRWRPKSAVKVMKNKTQYVAAGTESPIDKELKDAQEDDNHSWELKKGFTVQETTMALRNHGSHSEGLRYDITPLGMHYLLIHFDIPDTRPDEFKLRIDGKVSRPSTFTLSELQRRPRVSMPIVMECAGNGRTFMTSRFNKHVPWNREAVSQSVWTGCLLMPLLEELGISKDAVDVVFTGTDWGYVNHGKSIEHKKTKNPRDFEAMHFARSLNLADDPILHSCLLAYEVNGSPLPPQHGAPLRLIVPGWYGHASVKWLSHIEVTDKRFHGHFMRVYTYAREEEDKKLREPVAAIRPRAVIHPPGVPHFFERTRFLQAGATTLFGRAWVGGTTHLRRIQVVLVELSFDGGASWQPAELEKASGPWGWAKWTYRWDAKPGIHTICVRATDSDSNTQKTQLHDSDWSYHGMANTVVERLQIVVLPTSAPGSVYHLPLIETYAR